MKIQNIILAVICGLATTTVAQNAGANRTNANLVPDSGNQRRSIEPGHYNLGDYNPNYPTNYNRRSGEFTNGFGHGVITNGFGHGIITNGFGHGAITNGFGYGAISNRIGSRIFTNGYGDGGITNGFGDYTNHGINGGFGTNNVNMYGPGYTNHYRHYPSPYTTDPRVMGGNSLSNSNN